MKTRLHFRSYMIVLPLLMFITYFSGMVLADPPLSSLCPAEFKIIYQQIVEGAVIITAVKTEADNRKIDYSCDWRRVPKETAVYMLKAAQRTTDSEIKEETAKENKQLNPFTEVFYLGRQTLNGGIIFWEKNIQHNDSGDEITYCGNWSGPCRGGFASLGFSGVPGSKDPIVKWINFIVTGRSK